MDKFQLHEDDQPQRLACRRAGQPSAAVACKRPVRIESPTGRLF